VNLLALSTSLKNIFIGFTCTLAVVGSLHAQSVLEKAKKDQIVNVAKEDPAMLAAFGKAKASLDDFLSKAKNPAPNTVSYFMKVGIRDGADIEYFWIGDFENTGKKFTGVINNQPRIVENVEAGDDYEFNQDEIVDWMYIDTAKKRMFGNFTLCAILSHEPAQQAAATMKQYGLVCEK
jgi:uncharacterized protein YegJ (DUF2314 family)